jgi:spoIIIJ-associated protein
VTERESLVLEAASPEEALEAAAAKWYLEPEDLHVELVDEEKRFFGLLGKRTTYKVVPVFDRSFFLARNTLRKLLAKMGLDLEATLREDGVMDLAGPDKDLLLASNETMRSLEYVLNLMLREELQGQWIKLDSEGYRERRQQALATLALSAAEDALSRRRPVSLEPMTSWERRLIHVELKDRTDVETRSVGEEPLRRVVIWPKKSAAAARGTVTYRFRNRK